jgi:hypothetical protein
VTDLAEQLPDFGGLLGEVVAQISRISPEERRRLEDLITAATATEKFVPLPGPQTLAFRSPADVLLYGGSPGGGGKSTLLAGLALTQHKKSLLVRATYGELENLIDQTLEMNGTRAGYNGGKPQRLRVDAETRIDFGAIGAPGSERHWQGKDHDFFGADEVVNLRLEAVRYIMTWVRSTDPNVRCRTVMATNPPVTMGADQATRGDWIYSYFRPWLDPTHDNPADPGELRWFITAPDGSDLEVDGPTPRQFDQAVIVPKSRTVIFATLGDNPYLVRTGYGAQLDAMPEPMRSAMRHGDFSAARQDHPDQVIPLSWVEAAQRRWEESPPFGIPMGVIGGDIAQGGPDSTVLAFLYDYWFNILKVPGKDTPNGSDVAALIFKNRRDNASIVIDLGGGFGGATLEHLKSNDLPAFGYKGANAATDRTRDRALSFFNLRSQVIWQFREALDPDQTGGSVVALPPSRTLVSDLTAPRLHKNGITQRGLQIETKDDVCERLGRSPDEGDAVMMAWWGRRYLIDARTGYAIRRQEGIGRTPKVVCGRVGIGKVRR